MDPPEIQHLKDRFFEIKKTYVDPAWLSPNAHRKLTDYAVRARQLKAFILAAQIYIFIGEKREIEKMIYEIFKNDEFALGSYLVVNYAESENKYKFAKILESGYDEWYWAAAIWHSIADERKLFCFGIRAYLAAIKYSQEEEFSLARDAFGESIYAFSKLKFSSVFSLGENPEHIVRRIISVMGQFLPDEHANYVARYIETNEDNNDYFGDEFAGTL